MPDLIKWKEKIEKGLDALLENKRELELRINRQEGALQLAQLLVQQAESEVATVSVPEEVEA